ncbi:MAG: hypothetical protein IPK07_31475 [Deltaproteobacteria bacterium]|nr:hypothetical protein [Deltaproteobacteria bacterium]
MVPQWKPLALAVALAGLARAAPGAEPVTAPATALSAEAADATRFRLEAERRKVVAANLSLTPDEASAFWPTYDEYRARMHALDVRHLAVLERYAEASRNGTWTDSQATSMLDELLATGTERATTRKDWRERFASVLPPRKVVAVYQLENRLDAVVTLGVASQLPLAQ